jgi:hypothetical protein
MPRCLCCGKPIDIPKGEISDGCCSDACWESFYAPGPQDEAELELNRIQEFSN